jgi:DNA mismatch repair protein MutS2
MGRLREATTEAEARVSELKRREAALTSERLLIESAATEETLRRRDEARRSLASALEDFREQSRRELAAITDAKERTKIERAHLRAEGRLRSLARDKQDTIAPKGPAGAPAPFALAPGATVRILSLEREGTVLSVVRDRIEVRMGAATFTVAREDLAPATGEARAETPPPGKPSRLAALAASSRSAGSKEPLGGVPIELHLLGQTVDEALPALDRFLDASVRFGRQEVRVVHGHGTGRLKRAVRAHLTGHPQVESLRPGAQGEGGDGATVVTLH